MLNSCAELILESKLLAHVAYGQGLRKETSTKASKDDSKYGNSREDSSMASKSPETDSPSPDVDYVISYSAGDSSKEGAY